MSCACKALLAASKPPAIKADKAIVFVNFIVVLFMFGCKPPYCVGGGCYEQTFICNEGYNVRKTFAAALTVFSMSAAECAVDRKPASNCDGAK